MLLKKPFTNIDYITFTTTLRGWYYYYACFICKKKTEAKLVTNMPLITPIYQFDFLPFLNLIKNVNGSFSILRFSTVLPLE